MYMLEQYLKMPNVNTRQELTYAHPTPERVAEIQKQVAREKQEITDRFEIDYAKKIRKPMIDLYKQIISELAPTLSERESKQILEEVSKPVGSLGTERQIKRLQEYAAQLVP
jgi:hypothetical protein